MKHFYLFFALILFANFGTSGQSLPVKAGSQKHAFPLYSDSAKWNVLISSMWTGKTYVFKYMYDTVFCGHTYSKMKMTVTTGYIRADSLRAFGRLSSNCLDKEYLMHDYSMQVGDSAWFGNGNYSGLVGSDTSLGKVSAIDTVNYSGIMRRRFKMSMKYDSPTYNASETWIEGIGSVNDPFFILNCHPIPGPHCDVVFRLLCLDSSGVNLYKDSTYQSCDVTITGMQEVSGENSLRLFPNPGNGDTELDFGAPLADRTEVSLYDILGKRLRTYILMQGSEGFSIRERGLAAGLYYIEVKDRQAVRTIKMLVKN